jgi:hypothetical protein
VNRLLIALVFLASWNDHAHAAGPADDRGQAAAARKILDAWHASHAEPCDRFLHVVCWTPSDREFPAEHRARLTRILRHVRDFYAREMTRHGLGPLTFKLQSDDAGRIVFHEVRSAQPTAAFGKRSGSEIRQECVPSLRKAGIDADGETIALFCNLASWDEKELRFSHESPYYAGGGHRSGTAWQLDSPELDVLNLPKTKPVIRDGQYGAISLGKHNSFFIGGVAHELGHAFGLPHNAERPDESVRGTALMGAGNQTYGDETRGEGRGTFLPSADALRLASHPLFCGRLETQTHRPESSLSNLAIRAEGPAIVVSGVVRGEPTVYGVVAYFDPEENSDYNQTSMTAVPAADGRFELRSDALARGKRGILHLVPLHANGSIDDEPTRAAMRYVYRIAEDGTPDLGPTTTRLAIGPIVWAIQKEDVERARNLAGKLTDERATAIARSLLQTDPPQTVPADGRRGPLARSLTDFKADIATVGWETPTFNRIPDDSLLLESAGEIYATGIYAHAPARHEYLLGRQWESLQGRVGIATGHVGSVVFEISGDGRRLWRSPTVKSDSTVSFDVPVRGVKRLTLTTSPTDDGTSADWGLWLEPELRRSTDK